MRRGRKETGKHRARKEKKMLISAKHRDVRGGGKST